MLFSTSFVLVAAIGAQAFPQEVQPISQISDGQIQAPPATAVPSVSYGVPAPSEVLPSVTPVPLPSAVPSVAPVPLPSVVPSVVPSVPAVPSPSGYVPAPVPSVPAVPSNGTVLPSSAPSYPNGTTPSGTGAVSTSTPATTSASSPQPTESAPVNNGAALNMVSFAAVAAGLFAYLA